ncbi:hypothetical protein ACFWPP_04885 [Streptomyces anulatus]|uniref:hypothetical protein n=1 Tax=Streptomyces anulatus TaxID=1892 RepID=UPI0036613B48
MTYRTVKQLADTATPEELFTGQWQNRPSALDDHKPHLDDRWSEDCTNAWKLWEEIVPPGHKSSYQRVRAYLHDKRTSPQPVTERPPSPRTAAGSILRRPDTLTETEQLQLKAVRTHCSELDASPGTSAPSRPCSPSARASACPTGTAPSGRTACPASTHSPPAPTATSTATPSSPD